MPTFLPSFIRNACPPADTTTLRSTCQAIQNVPSSFRPAGKVHAVAHDSWRRTGADHRDTIAFALAVPHEEALRIADDVGFFQAVRTAVIKTTTSESKASGAMDHAIRQIVSRAVLSDEVIDVFAAAGLKKPNISILSEEFLAEVRGMQHKSLALEALRKLLNDEIKTLARTNLVQSRSFAALLAESVRRYQNRALEAAQVIDELIGLARDMREAGKRGKSWGYGTMNSHFTTRSK